MIINGCALNALMELLKPAIAHSINLSSPRLVLDTNVVLDCLVFRDPAVRNLMTAIEAKCVQTLVHPVTLDELKRVLAYPQCRLNAAEQQQVLDRYLGLGTLAAMPEGFSRETLLLPTDFPRCRDHDDQPFLALAFHARAEGLVTKDKLILKLRKKVRKFGVLVFAPADLKLPEV
jgi:putative PIN family toxin of toxin-antitoxin system